MEDYEKRRDETFEISKSLWIESQQNYIDELMFRKQLAQKEVDHTQRMIEHETMVLNEYLEHIKEE